MARRRGTRVVTRGPGLVGPLDRLADVGPSNARPADRPARRASGTPARPDREGLEARLGKWFEERERFDRRPVVNPPAPDSGVKVEPTPPLPKKPVGP